MNLSRPNELLETHSTRMHNNHKRIKIEKIIKNIIDTSLPDELKKYNEIVYKMFDNSLKYHDEGKKNPYFQHKVGNAEYSKFIGTESMSRHSTLGAFFCMLENYKLFKDLKIDKKMRRFLTKKKFDTYMMYYNLLFCFGIEKHHSGLSDVDLLEFMDKLIYFYEDNKELFVNIEINIDIYNEIKELKNNLNFNNLNVEPYSFYLLGKLSYSSLVLADYMAVYEHYNKEKFKINRVDEDKRTYYREKFNQNDVIQGINNYREDGNINSQINQYRSDMFIESEKTLLREMDSNLFFLEAPTGSGKSLTGLNLMLQLLERTDKLVYVSPLNNISEQTYDNFKDIIGDDVKLINSRTEIPNDEENECSKDYLNYQTLNYNISIVSHVKLFDMLFGSSRSELLMLPLLVGSTIVIDEVQNYKNKIWKQIINSLKNFAELLNIKIVIMSATLPKMEELLENNAGVVNLIKDTTKYYDFFKNRVKLNFDMLSGVKNTVEDVYNKIEEVIGDTNKHRILIECLTTKRAEEMYEYLSIYKDEGFLVYKMLGITERSNREYIINQIQKKEDKEYVNKKIILIGTQCIEAGIDIDMQVGFKDISIIDAEEQFVGRIERNFNDTGVCYFFDIDDGDFIYKGDYRTENNISDIEWRRMFVEKNFKEYYSKNYKWLLEEERYEYDEFLRDMIKYNILKIKSNMKLIDSKNYSFLMMVKKNIRGKIVDASEVFEQYMKTKDIKDYNKKMIRQREIKIMLNEFTYSINALRVSNEPCYKRIEGIYVIEDDAIENYSNVDNDEIVTKESVFNLEYFLKQLNGDRLFI